VGASRSEVEIHSKDLRKSGPASGKLMSFPDYA